MMLADQTMLNIALAYAARGWAVLALWWGEDGICACPRGSECESPGKHPIAYIGKRPICPSGVKDATIDPELIRLWWARIPDANIGIATGAISGVIALDNDPRNGGSESLRMLEDSLPDGLPDTPRSLTGSGGEHVLLAHPGIRVANFKGKDWSFPGLDVKGDGGYIVAPPSMHVSGRRYEWDSGFHPEDMPIAAMPPALVQRLTTGATTLSLNGTSHAVVTAGGTDIGSVLEGVPDGERGVMLFRLAAKLRRVDVPYAVARELVLQAAAAAKPAYAPTAAIKHLDSAFNRYEPSDVIDEAAPEAGEDGPSAPRFRWWSLDELEASKPPVWLIDNTIVAGSFAMMAGRERSLKSFGVLDMGLSIAANLPWQGMKVQHGPVGYVVAEGRSGITRRVSAWCIARGVTKPKAFRVLPQPVQMLEPKDVDELLISVLAWPAMPVLIIIDTLARCFVGGDENSAKDMGEFVAACDRLQRGTGATVLIVHHGTKADGGARGSSALLAAVDTHINVSRDMDANRITLKCEKQKDADEFEPMMLEPQIVGLPNGESSLVLGLARMTAEGLSRAPKVLMDALRRFDRPVANAEWCRSSIAQGVTERSFYRAKKNLVADGYVIVTGTQPHETYSEKQRNQTTDTTDTTLTQNNVSRNLRTDTTDTPFKGVSMSVGLAVEKTPDRACEDCGNPTGSELHRFCPSCRMRTN